MWHEGPQLLHRKLTLIPSLVDVDTRCYTSIFAGLLPHRKMMLLIHVKRLCDAFDGAATSD